MVPIPSHPVDLTALEATTTGIALLDPHGVILAVSPAWQPPGDATSSGLPRSAVGSNYLQVCDASPDPAVRWAAQGIRRVMAGEVPEYVQAFPSQHQAGASRIRLRVMPLSDGPRPAWTFIVQEAVPPDPEDQAGLQEHLTFLHRVLEISPDCVKVLSLQGELVWMNQAGMNLMDIDDFETVRGVKWITFWPSGVRDQVQQALDAAQRGEQGRFQARGPTFKGTVKDWDVLITPLQDAQGHPAQLLCTARDLTALREAQDEALRSAQESARILSSIQEAFLAVDDQWRFTHLNARAEQLLSNAAADVLGKNLWEVFPDAVDGEFFQQYHAARRDQRTVQFEAYFAPLRAWFRINAHPHEHGLAVFFQNINAEKAEEQAQQDRNAILEMTVAGRPLPDILEHVARMVERQLPEHLCAVHFLRHGTLSPYAAPSFPDDLRRALEHLDVREGHGTCSEAVLTGRRVVAENTATHPACVELREILLVNRLHSCVSLPIMDGAQVLLGTLALYAPAPGPFSAGAMGALEKARHLAAVAIEHARLTEELAFQAKYDSLTGLSNRLMFEEQLGAHLNLAQQVGGPVALLYLDVDDFKGVNDHLGHHVGDLVLRELAGRLRAAVRSGDVLARLSGDEFGVILPHATEAAAVLVAQRIMAGLQSPFEVSGREVFIGVSIGVSLTTEGGSDPVSLKRSADLAMYHAKSQRTGFAVFRSEMNRRAYERFQLATYLRRAIELRELDLHYQPQVELRSGAVVGVEALLRWRHPELGPVSPVHFIPVAEETGLIVSIGEWVLQQACAQGAAWQREGRSPVRISVNVSALQFERPDFVETVARCLASTGFPAKHLDLELTERVVMHSVEDSVRRMQELRDLGVQISMDDFGTGYSSLSYLPRLPLNTLKIDRSFVSGLACGSANFPVVQAILSLAGSLQLSVVAEGVETEAERQVLLELGCTLGQGYLFARPGPATDLFPEQ